MHNLRKTDIVMYRNIQFTMTNFVHSIRAIVVLDATAIAIETNDTSSRNRRSIIVSLE